MKIINELCSGRPSTEVLVVTIIISWCVVLPALMAIIAILLAKIKEISISKGKSKSVADPWSPL